MRSMAKYFVCTLIFGTVIIALSLTTAYAEPGSSLHGQIYAFTYNFRNNQSYVIHVIRMQCVNMISLN